MSSVGNFPAYWSRYPRPQGLHRRSRHNIPPHALIFGTCLVSTKLLSVHSCMLFVHLFLRLPLLLSVHNVATKGPFTLGGIPDGIPRGIALFQWVHIYLFLRDTRAVRERYASGTRAVRERYRARSLRERFWDIDRICANCACEVLTYSKNP